MGRYLQMDKFRGQSLLAVIAAQIFNQHHSFE
jgi:hypothetical protein